MAGENMQFSLLTVRHQSASSRSSMTLSRIVCYNNAFEHFEVDMAASRVHTSIVDYIKEKKQSALPPSVTHPISLIT